MKKYFLSLTVIVVFAFYTIFNNQNNTSVMPPATPTTTASGLTGTTGATTSTGGTRPPGGTSGGTSPTGTGGTGSPPATKPKGLYVDGTYTGASADAFYGTVQVAAVVASGKLTDVQFLQYPSGGGHTMEVSSYALPQLRREAIVAQNANVNTVSGATDTSAAFRQSLADALAQAKA